MLSAVTVRDAWCQILNWIGPSSKAETLFLERQLEIVPNYGDEDPKLFFSRVDQLLTRLRSANVHRTERQIVNMLVRNLSDHYAIEKRSRLDSPSPAPRRGAYCPCLLDHPQDAPARTAVGIRGDAQPTRACCPWRVWRTEERQW